MKKTYLLIIGLLSSVFGFQTAFAEEIKDFHPEIRLEKANNFPSWYTNIGFTAYLDQAMPAITLGKKVIDEQGSGVNISFSMSGFGKVRREDKFSKKESFFTFSFPQVDYLQRISKNLFIGTGASFGGVYANSKEKTYDKEGFVIDYNEIAKDFYGVMGRGIIGYEFYRNDSNSGVAQIEVSQPLIPVYSEEKSFDRPLFQCSLGIGF